MVASAGNPTKSEDSMERLQKLKVLKDQGFCTEEEFEGKASW